MIKSPAMEPLLACFSVEGRSVLQDCLSQESFAGVLPSSIVLKLLRIEHLNNVGDLALKLLSLARCYASAPTSKFQVGAVGEGISGALYLGANLEIAGQALPFTVHAEQSVIVSALSHRERGVKLLAVSSPPCGHCRQFLNELGQSAQLRVVVEDKEPTYLGELLPKAFGPADLGVRGALLMHSQWQLSTESGNPDPVAQAGIDAAHLSYSPYTRSPSGVAVAMSDSRIVAAPYVENAAFNPSLAPILAVLDRLRFNGGISEIQSAVLVETSDSKISQRALTELILTAIAPKIKLRIVTAKIIG